MIELLVVIVIIGLMAGIAIPTFARFGFFSRNETQIAAAELYKLLNASKVYAATYRVNAGLAYGIELKRDSLSGLALEAIDAVAMVYRLPDPIRRRCYFYADMNGNPLPEAVPIPENDSGNLRCAAGNPTECGNDDDKEAYVLITGEHERGSFRALPEGAVLLADNLLPDGAGNPTLSNTLKSIRIYTVTARYDDCAAEPRFEAQVVSPLRVADDNQDILGNLRPEAPSLQYLAAMPAGSKYLEFKRPVCGGDQSDLGTAPTLEDIQDFRFPAHVFTSSGRMEMYDSTRERLTISVGYAPDVDPQERFTNSADRSDGLRTKDIEIYRGTGRVSIVPEES